MRAAFRQPTTSEQTDGQPVEEYTTRRKIAEPDKAIYAVMGTVSTFGLGEFVWCPAELYRTTRRATVGQRLRFTYDAAGNVTAIRFDGEPVALPPRVAPPPEEEPSGPNTSAPIRL